MVLIILTACKPEDPSPDDITKNPASNSEDILLNDNVRLIDSTNLILNVDTVLLNKGQFEFTIAGLPPKINVNDIIVGSTGGGYIRKVVSVNQQQDKIILETTQGTMEDVFNKANISFSTSMNSLKSTNDTSEYAFDLSGKTLYTDGPLSITIENGKIDVGGIWRFIFEYNNSTLDTFEISATNATFNGQFSLNVTASEAITIGEHTSTLGRFAKSQIILVGGVPLVVKTEVELRCLFNAKTSATFKRNVKINTTNTANIGLKYMNSKWNSNFDIASNSSIFVGENSGSVNTEINMSLVPFVSFRLYRVLGPYASIGLKELIKVNDAVSGQEWDFYAGAWIQTILGARADILGKSLFDVNKIWNTDTVSYQTPYKLEKTSGDNQTGTANEYLSQPLKVRVTDNNGKSEPDVPVYFKVVSGGGSVETSSVLSDKDGYAQTRWKIGSQNVIQMVEGIAKKVDGSLVKGAPVQFATSANPAGLATLTTNDVTSITHSSAISGGTILNDGGDGITAKGVCWSLTPNPTIDLGTKTINGAGNETFSSSISDLLVDKTYYIRAYATNKIGTAYGNEISFTTTSSITLKGSTYTLVSWRYGAPVPGDIDFYAPLYDGPRPKIYIAGQEFTFYDTYFKITLIEPILQFSTTEAAYPHSYSIGVYHPDSLFLSYGPGSNGLNSYGHQYPEGWGLKLPPGYDLELDTGNEYFPSRLSKDGEYIYRAQNGDMVYRRK